MFKEGDYGGLSLGARVAWCAVAIMLFFVVLPAALPNPRSVEVAPKKTMYTVPLYCYPEAIGTNAVLICDRPPTPLVGPNNLK